MTPREGAFIGGIIGLAGGGVLGLIGKRMIRGNTDLKALTFTGVTMLGTYVGAVIGAGTCPNNPCPQAVCPPCPQVNCPPPTPCPPCPPAPAPQVAQ